MKIEALKNTIEKQTLGREGCSAILVAYYFPPLNVVATSRTLRMARGLLEKFERVYVITQPDSNVDKKFLNYQYGADVTENPRIFIIKSAPLLSSYGVGKSSRLLHRLTGAFLTRVFCSNGSEWIPALRHSLKTIPHRESIKIVISSGGPFVSFLPVLSYSKKHGIPCILDYRDLWSQNPRAPYPKIFRILVQNTIERFVNSRCNLITTVSEGCARSLRGNDHNLNVRVLANTPDEAYIEWFNQQSPLTSDDFFDSKCFNIALVGTVYEECTCRLLALAISLLPLAIRDKVKVHYFGASESLVAMEFDKHKVPDNYINHGIVTKQIAVGAVKGADALLSLVYDQPSVEVNDTILGLMTTKVFDYFLSGRPILNIGPDNADLNKFVKAVDYADFFSFDSYQEVELSDFIISAVQNLKDFRDRHSNIDLPDFTEKFAHLVNDAIYSNV